MFPKFKAWFVKHNRVIAGYTAIVVFLGILLGGISISLNEEDPTTDKINALFRSRSFTSEAKCTSTTQGENCNIKCGQINEDDDLESKINEIMINCTYIHLEINSMCFKDGVLPNNWLKYVNAQIIHLTLEESNLEQISEGAFQNEKLHLKHLSILNSKMTNLQKNHFTGLDDLVTFEFKFREKYSGLKWIEQGVLDVLPNLNDLNVELCLTSEEQVANLTGGDGSPLNLISLSLENNALEKLTDNSLRRATKIVNLYLRYNNLAELSREFLWSPNLIQIHIENNTLVTLQNGIFNGLPINYKVFAGHNPWICDCNLLWLHELAGIPNTPISEPLPKCGEINIDKFDFRDCSASSTTTSALTTRTTTPIKSEAPTITSPTAKPTTPTTTRSTTVTTKTPTTTKSNPLITKCENDIAKLIREDTINSCYEKIEVILDHHLTKIEFHDLIDGSLATTALNISGPKEIYKLVFLHPIENCYEFAKKYTILLDLKRSTTYTMCLAEDTLSCFGLKVKPPYGERAWIINNQKVGLISAAVGTGAASLFLVGLSMFYCLRQHPELLKGNKRIIIVRKKRTEALVMPKYYNNPNYTPSGYLTPNTPLYERINYNNRHRGSSSDNSDYIRTEIKPPPLPQRRGQPFIIS